MSQRRLYFSRCNRGRKRIGNVTYMTKSGKVQKYICRNCGRVFCGRTYTVFYDLRTEEDEVLLTLKMILKGMSLRGVAEVLEVYLYTVRRWLSRAAEHSEEVNEALIKELVVSTVELDELWTFVQKNKYREWMRMRTSESGSG